MKSVFSKQNLFILAPRYLGGIYREKIPKQGVRESKNEYDFDGNVKYDRCVVISSKVRHPGNKFRAQKCGLVPGYEIS
jgi:hypothetical protein